MDQETTARPWKLDICKIHDTLVSIEGAAFDTVLQGHHRDIEWMSVENAELIITAVNAHDDMLTALVAVEWSKDEEHTAACPICEHAEPPTYTDGKQGHKADCLLGVAIAKGRGNV